MMKQIVPVLCLTALASACSGSGSGSSSTSTSGSGSSSGSSSSSSSSSSSGGSSGATVYCNGSMLMNGGGTFFVATYPKSDDIRTGCAATFAGLTDGGANAFGDVSGILDVDSYGDAGSSAFVYTVYPSGCEDLGTGSAPVIPNAYATDGGGVSVATAVSGQSTVPLMWGVITFISAPYTTTSTGAQHSGTAYIQDITGGAGSGVSIYFPKASAPAANGGAAPGAVGYPMAGLHRGDVVGVTNVKWSPYLGQKQFEFQATSAIIPLGTSPLPASVNVTDAQIAPGATVPANVGMRVTVSGPNTVSDACPLILQSH
jgi:hypothetical protein